jgi:Uma2 family endonuclease
MTTIRLDQRLFTTGEYERMIETGILTEDERVELIQGAIRPMSPIGSRHAACVNRLSALLNRALLGRGIVSVQNPIRLSDESEPQPDVAVLRSRADFYALQLPRPGDVLLVVEVADTTWAYDHDTKLPMYASAGIAEAWLVDLNQDVVELHLQPLSNRYGRVTTLQRGDAIRSITLGVEVNVDEILG